MRTAGNRLVFFLSLSRGCYCLQPSSHQVRETVEMLGRPSTAICIIIFFRFCLWRYDLAPSLSGLRVKLCKMNLSSGLKLFWQAIPEPARVLEVGKAFPLLGSSVSQQVGRLHLRLLSKPLTGLKERAAFNGLPPSVVPEDWEMDLFTGSCVAHGALCELAL